MAQKTLNCNRLHRYIKSGNVTVPNPISAGKSDPVPRTIFLPIHPKLTHHHRQRNIAPSLDTALAHTPRTVYTHHLIYPIKI